MYRLILPLLLIFSLLGSPVWAAPPAVTGSVSTATGTNTTTHSSITVPADATLALIGVSLLGTSPSGVVSASVGAGSASLVTGCDRTQGNTRTQLWAVASPPTGTQTVSVDASGGTITNMVTGVIFVTGSATSSIFGTCMVDGTSDSSINTINGIVTTTDNLVVLIATAQGLRTFSPAGSAPLSTERYDLDRAGNVSGAGYTETGGAATTDMVVDISSSTTHSEVAVAIAAASAGGATPRNLMLLGVGP